MPRQPLVARPLGERVDEARELAIGARARHQADRNKHERTDREHENCVMQEVHVNQPADRWRLEVAAGAIGKFEYETRSTQDEAGQE